MLPGIWREAGLVRGVEIGTFRGDFAAQIKESFPECQLSCVDPWVKFGSKSAESQEGYCLEACWKLGPLGVNIIRLPSLQAVAGFEDGSLGWVWIDGDHSFDGAVMDIIAWSPKVCPGGMICVHDYDTYQTGVVDAVNGFTRAHGIKDWYVTREYPSTAIWINPCG